MTLEITLRLFVALLLGGIVGIEREFRSKDAGFRTHFLVALGSALFCIVSQYGFGIDLKDSSRVAAQVVSGIGFLGAGTIIFQKNMVRGLTTAAGLWVTAAIGLRYGNVCCGRDRHGDDTDGTGGARRLDPTGGNDDREPDFLGRKRASKEWSIRSRTTVSSYIPMN